ncbi:MAG: DMT family transporter [Oscillospiraceae bacterium]|jgi:drug/metabolite transporter (DMT)-like permease|nr:DMT family transporter [Oscillospiraceae bacterium]
MQDKKTPIATLCLFLTAAIWGFAFVAQVQGMEYMGTLTFGGIRFALGTLSLLPVILLFERGKSSKAEKLLTLKYGSVTGLILFAASTLQQYGIELTGSAGKAGFLTGLYIVLVPLFGVFLGKRPTWLTYVAALFALGGLYFLSVPDGFGALAVGDLLLIICAVFWTMHIIAVDTYACKVRPLRFSFVQFATCAVLSLIGMLIFEQPSVHAIQSGMLPILYGGIGSVGIAYTLQIIGQRHVEPSKAAIVFSLESLFAAIGGFLLLHEQLGWKGYLGGGLMFVGILLSQLRIAPHKSDNGSSENTADSTEAQMEPVFAATE